MATVSERKTDKQTKKENLFMHKFMKILTSQHI